MSWETSPILKSLGEVQDLRKRIIFVCGGFRLLHMLLELLLDGAGVNILLMMGFGCYRWY